MATLWAISDLHTGHTGNKPVTESLHPSSPDDWLIVAGDVAERTDEIRWALDLLRKRFAKVIWVPGNHELWTTSKDPMQVFGRARYDYLVNMCDEMGVVTPEHPFPVWTERGRPGHDRADVPALRLHVPAGGSGDQGRGSGDRRERNVVATDEFLLSTEPYATRDAWCRDRLAHTRKRLEDLDWMTPTVLVNHFPLVREPCDALFYPEFSLWCGTTATADWHTRYNAICSVYGHLHIPRTTWYDGVRFEEVSVGYPREWRRRKPYRWLRQVLPDPQYAPGYLNEFGGHFEITPEMRDTGAQQIRERLNGRRAVAMTSRTLLSDGAAATRRSASPPRCTPTRRSLAPLPEEEPLIAQVGGQAAQRVHHRPPLRPAGAGRARRAAGADPQGRQGRTVLARRRGRQPHPLRGLPRRGRRAQRRGALGRHRRRTARRAAQGCARRDQPACRTRRDRRRCPTGLHWDRILFCAKEATYKAWFPLTQRWLGFEDAHITFDRRRRPGPRAVSRPRS